MIACLTWQLSLAHHISSGDGFHLSGNHDQAFLGLEVTGKDCILPAHFACKLLHKLVPHLVFAHSVVCIPVPGSHAGSHHHYFSLFFRELVWLWSFFPWLWQALWKIWYQQNELFWKPALQVDRNATVPVLYHFTHVHPNFLHSKSVPR